MQEVVVRGYIQLKRAEVSAEVRDTQVLRLDHQLLQLDRVRVGRRGRLRVRVR